MHCLYFFFHLNGIWYQVLLCFSAGGLVTAVAPVVVETQGLWVGWSGLHLEDENLEIPEADPNDQSPTAGLKSSQVSGPLRADILETF